MVSADARMAAPVVGAASPSVQSLRGLLHRIGGRGAGLRLQPIEIIGGLLRVAGSGEDRARLSFFRTCSHDAI